MNSRIKKAYLILQEQGLDGLIVSWPANISYLLKFLSRESYFLLSPKENIYFTDSRYTQEVATNLKGNGALEKTNGSVFKSIADSCLTFRLKRIGFEERYLPFAEYKKIKETLKSQAKLIPSHSLIEGLRQIKDIEELENLKKAVKITGSALKFARSFISKGITEIEVVGELQRFIRLHGACDSSFDIIVAFGRNSSFPHHIPSQRKLNDNEPVLIDIGVDYQGYKSDLTRVFFFGKINVLGQKIYDIVLSAQEKAIKKIKPGERISDIDKASRQHIAQSGYGAFFGHNLGHGIGLEVHEAPHISVNEKSRLEPGMVFTVEPAVYLPRKFGIRIEDDVLVTQKGCEVLSGSIHK
jgi:Xaa-Pro aminopeptidase